MADQVFPTKGNLLNVKKSLSLAKVGYELLDRKRNVLIRELMMMVDAAKALRSSISETYKDAYNALQKANITMGLISRVAEGMPVEKSVNVTYRSVMGCELPKVTLDPPDSSIPYGFENTDGNVDVAYISFGRVKQMTAMLAEVDNSVFRLANAIKKTQTRANALKNIVIPDNVTYVGAHAFNGNTSLTVYVQDDQVHDGWNARWNSAYRPAVLGCEVTTDDSGTYVVSFVKNKQTLLNFTSVKDDSSDVTSKYSDPTRQGYEFGGWTTTGEEPVVYKTTQVADVPDDTELIAIWNKID